MVPSAAARHAVPDIVTDAGPQADAWRDTNLTRHQSYKRAIDEHEISARSVGALARLLRSASTATGAARCGSSSRSRPRAAPFGAGSLLRGANRPWSVGGRARALFRPARCRRRPSRCGDVLLWLSGR